MNRMHRLTMVALFAGLSSLLLYAPRAASADDWSPPVFGPDRTTNVPKHEQGQIRQTNNGRVIRQFDYMIRPLGSSGLARYRSIRATGDPRQTGPQLAVGTDLYEGVLYFHIMNTTRPRARSVDVVGLVNDDPVQYVPVMMRGLVTEGLLEDNAAQAATPLVIDLIDRGAARPYRSGSAGRRENRIQPDIDGLVDDLLAPPKKNTTGRPGFEAGRPDPGRAAIAIELTHRASEVPAVRNYIASIAFPFVMTRRLVGGAEGTEGVVWIEPDANDPNACDIYYAYLSSPTETPMMLAGWTCDDRPDSNPPACTGGRLIEQSLPKENYVRARMKKRQIGVSVRWFVESFDAPALIPTEGPVYDMIQSAFCDACELNAFAVTDVPALGLTRAGCP